MLGHRDLNIDDCLAILRRRLWIILIPVVLCPVGAYLYSLTLPNRYTSQTLVLVEQQKVPESFVRSVVTQDLAERLGTMQEQILSRTRLLPIIERFGLFKDEVGKVPMEDLVDRLRASLSIVPVRSVAGGRQGELPGFYISFTGNNPRLAQQVCAEITSMFIEENLRLREQRGLGTTEFLSNQLDESKRKLDDHDQKLAQFKARYVGTLPGNEQTNLNMLTGLSARLDAVTQALNRAQQDKAYTESVLAQQLAVWESSKTSTVPGSQAQPLEVQLANLENQLARAESRYTPDHPDIIRLRNEVAQLKREIESQRATNSDKSGNEDIQPKTNEPPQFQQLRTQIYQLEQTIGDKTREQARIEQQIRLFQSRLSLSPVVEQQYKELTRDYETALRFYNELLAKKSQSEMATNLERRQQGEQFRVMDPANLPEKPSYPNRPFFASAGLGIGLALGVGIALLLEFLDKAIRTESDVEFYLQLPTLASVPYVSNEGRKTRVWARTRTAGSQRVGGAEA